MRYKLRDLRIFPFVMIVLFFLMVLLNLRSKSRSHLAPAVIGAGAQNPSQAMFNEFEAIMLKAGSKNTEDTMGVSQFEIKTNEKWEEIQCRLKYRMKKEGDLFFIFSWFHENTLMKHDTIWYSASENTAMSRYMVERKETGHWSVDIGLKDNILLKTLCFEVSAGKEPAHFRSLKTDF